MSIDIRELDASPTLRNLSKEQKQAVVRLMELSIEETMKANNARIEELETAANKAVEWLHHYPDPDNMEEQMVVNATRARSILGEALTK